MEDLDGGSVLKTAEPSSEVTCVAVYPHEYVHRITGSAQTGFWFSLMMWHKEGGGGREAEGDEDHQCGSDDA